MTRQLKDTAKGNALALDPALGTLKLVKEAQLALGRDERLRLRPLSYIAHLAVVDFLAKLKAQKEGNTTA